MTALTNEIIGLIVVVVLIVVALVARRLLTTSRRSGPPRSGDAREAATPVSVELPRDHAPQAHAPRHHAMSGTSAFGPAPVWAGGPGSGPGDPGPPRVLPSVAPRPAPASRPVLPPPVAVPAPGALPLRGSIEGPASLGEAALADPEPEHGEALGCGSSTVRGAFDEQDVPDAVVADERAATGGVSTGEAPGGVVGGSSDPADLVAVPGNSAHASRVMHVSGLRSELAAAIPTDWLVVTPMELLGELPQAPGPESTPCEASRAPGGGPWQDVCVADIDDVSAVHDVREVSNGPEPAEPTLAETPVPGTPNPFSPAQPEAPTEDLGMPSSLLIDLLDSGRHRPT